MECGHWAATIWDRTVDEGAEIGRGGGREMGVVLVGVVVVGGEGPCR